MPLSYYPPALEILWNLIKENHINPELVFSKYDVKYGDLSNTEDRIPLKIIPLLWNDAYKLIDSPCFGLNGYKYFHPSYLGALGYGWLSSKTLREGFMRVSRFIQILSHAAQIRYKENDTEFTVFFSPHRIDSNPAQSNNIISSLLEMCRRNFSEPINPVRVTFIHSEPSCVCDYYAYFKSPVLFDQEFNSVTFSRKIIDTPLPGANAQLAQLNDQIMIKYIDAIESDNLVKQVKTIIAKNLSSGAVTVEMVARELSMSHRNLQRKLSEFDTSFTKLFEKSRYELAEKYVSEGKMNMTEITFILGFSELSSFSRAYKRWTGHSPRAE